MGLKLFCYLTMYSYVCLNFLFETVPFHQNFFLLKMGQNLIFNFYIIFIWWAKLKYCDSPLIAIIFSIYVSKYKKIIIFDTMCMFAETMFLVKFNMMKTLKTFPTCLQAFMGLSYKWSLTLLKDCPGR